MRRIFALLLVLAICLSIAACSPEPQGKIYLYGEAHNVPAIMDLELELWQDYYHNQGMRHLFTEHPYYAAAFLNLWMQAEDDTILLELYADWEGTTSRIESTLEFYRTIKETCPETIFHGTDIGHQHWNTGPRYLAYLEENGMTDSEEYRLTQEAIEQGETFYANSSHDWVYRENMMTANFIREFEALDGESIMGIYGAAHVGLDTLNHTGECDSMGKQLAAHFSQIITSEDLNPRARAEAQPERVDTLEINGKSYEAEYFGGRDLSESYFGYSHVAYWRLVDAYEDFSEADPTGTLMGESNWPMVIEEGYAYVVQYTYSDGRTVREYHICDGTLYQGILVTSEIYEKTIG